MSAQIRTHIEILSQAKWFLLLVTIVAGIAAFIWATAQPTSYKAVVAFDVKVANRATTPDYQYGAYYDLKGAELFSQHIMSWFKTPSFVEDLYKNAGLGYTIDSVSRFTGRFDAKQYSPQNVVVAFSDYDQANAQKLADSVAKTVEDRANTQVTTDAQAQFIADAQTPVIVATNMNSWIALAVGVVAGFALSIVLVYIREYFRGV